MLNADRYGRIAHSSDDGQYATVMESLECVAVETPPDPDLVQRATTLTTQPDRNETALLLVGDEFKTLMEVLEHVAKGFRRRPAKKLRERAFRLWERLLVEGGHVTPEELRRIRKKYGP